MIDPAILDEISAKITGLLPDSLQQVKKDVEKNVRASVQSTLGKFDLVSREEFDVQTAVLARTREKLQQLEKQVSELEARIAGNR